jgi:hypothetical protein
MRERDRIQQLSSPRDAPLLLTMGITLDDIP